MMQRHGTLTWIPAVSDSARHQTNPHPGPAGGSARLRVDAPGRPENESSGGASRRCRRRVLSGAGSGPGYEA